MTTRKRYKNPQTFEAQRRARKTAQGLREQGFAVEVPDEPDFEEVPVVEAEAIQDGKLVTIRVYADHVPQYEAIVAEARAAGQLEEEDPR